MNTEAINAAADALDKSATPPSPPFAVTIALTDTQVCDLLVTAIEGGSNYWCRIDKFIAPKTPDFSRCPADFRAFDHVAFPLTGGALKCRDVEGEKTYTLNLASIRRGLELFRVKAPNQFANFIAGSGDAWTGDSFLQCCLLGDVIYG